MSKLKEARDHIYKLEFRIADLTVENDRLRQENMKYAKQAVMLKEKLESMTCGECGKNMLECKCD